MFRCRPLVFLLLIVALAAACGGEPQTEYDEANDEAFLSACADSVTDELVQQRVCACALDEMKLSMSFARFNEINDQFSTNPTAPLPDDLVEIIAACVIEEADL